MLFGALLRAIPFGTTVVAFSFVIIVLNILLGCYYLDQGIPLFRRDRNAVEAPRVRG